MNFLSLSSLGLLALAPFQAEAALTDDFLAPLEARWIASEGTWTVQAGQAVAKGGFSRLVRNDFSGQDAEVTADVASMHDGPHASAGIQVRLGDDGMGYAVGVREIERGVDARHGPWERPVLQLFRIEPTGWKLLQECKLLNVRDGRLTKIKIQCKGPDIFVYHEDMETPVIREYDDALVRSGKVAMFKDQSGSATFDNVVISETGSTPTPSLRTDWSWVRGAIYVRSDAVNSVEMWHDYRGHENTVDRELAYAKLYGFNMVQVYLHWIVWERHGREYLDRIEDFLVRADRHGLKVNFIFWDDCGHVEPSLEFQLPVPGRHNSQMMTNPSHKIRDSKDALEEHRAKFGMYVSEIAERFKNDGRISFWQIYNEAMGAKETYRTSETDQNIDTLLRWTMDWIKATGTTIPVTATYGGFQGAKYSDFPSYHSYAAPGQALPNADGGPEHLCTETLNRPNAGMEKIFTDIVAKKNGFVAWELMIGRDNCRYPWGHPDGLAEPEVPFHGVIYPDGHPWSVDEVKTLLGPVAFAALPVFEATYYTGKFAKEMKKSIIPRIDFDLGDEPGTGSPDASAGIGKDDFSIRWKGSFIPEKSMAHHFRLDSDGVTEMKLNGQRLELHDGRCTVKLDAGTRYELEIGYYHEAGDARMKASVETVDGSLVPITVAPKS